MGKGDPWNSSLRLPYNGPQVGRAEQQKCGFSSSGRLGGQAQVSAGVVSLEASLLARRRAVFSLCLHMVFPLGVSVLISSFFPKDTSHTVGLEPT